MPQPTDLGPLAATAAQFRLRASISDMNNLFNSGTKLGILAIFRKYLLNLSGYGQINFYNFFVNSYNISVKVVNYK